MDLRLKRKQVAFFNRPLNVHVARRKIPNTGSGRMPQPWGLMFCSLRQIFLNMTLFLRYGMIPVNMGKWISEFRVQGSANRVQRENFKHQITNSKNLKKEVFGICYLVLEIYYFGGSSFQSPSVFKTSSVLSSASSISSISSRIK